MGTIALTPHDIIITHEVLDQGVRSRGLFDFVYIKIYIHTEDQILERIEVRYRFPNMGPNDAVTVNNRFEDFGSWASRCRKVFASKMM